MTGKTKKVVAVLAVVLVAGMAAWLAIRHAHQYRGRGHYPKSTWVAAGFAEPVPALETAGWAAIHGDGKMLLASLTPEFQAPLRKDWEASAKAQGQSPEDYSATHVRKILDSLLGFRVLGERRVNNHEVLVHVYIQGLWMKATFRMKKIDNEWKVAGVNGG